MIAHSDSCRTKGTDGIPHLVINTIPDNVRKISSTELHITKQYLGKGVFGMCYHCEKYKI